MRFRESVCVKKPPKLGGLYVMYVVMLHPFFSFKEIEQAYKNNKHHSQ